MTGVSRSRRLTGRMGGIAVLAWTFSVVSFLAIPVGAQRQIGLGGDSREGLAQIPEIQFSIQTVLGQPNRRETMTNRIIANRGFQFGGVHVDRLGRIYVLDSGNNRILGFEAYQRVNQAPVIVIGQPSLTDSGSANGNNTWEAPPTAATLALLQYPLVITPAESVRFVQMATDQGNNLYVVDLNNNRVLKYNDPFATDQVADFVWGQSSFTTGGSRCGYAGVTPNASRLCTEFASTRTTWEARVLAAGVDVDSPGRVWVTDPGNHRVLRFPAGSKTANLVLGQPNFAGYQSPSPWGRERPLNRLLKPAAVKVHPMTGEVYVQEEGCAGQARIVVFTPPFTNGMFASRVIGQGDYQDTPPEDRTDWEECDDKWVHMTSGLHWARGFAFDPSGRGDIWVGDGSNNRVLLFDSQGEMADVIGQPGFDTRRCDGIPGVGYVQKNGSFGNLCDNHGEIGVDRSGRLWVTKTYYPRDIARFPLPLQRNADGLPISNGMLLHDADDIRWNKVSGKTFDDNFGLAVSRNSTPPQLYVGDSTRILVFNNYRSAPTFKTASYVVGQDSLDKNFYYSGGLFDGRPIGSLHAAGGWAGTAGNIYVFRIPITASGKNHPTVKVLSTDSNVVWADSGQRVSFNAFSGVYYDVAKDALWVSDHANNRVMRIHKPLTDAKVDLVLGQPNKTSTGDNAGRGGEPNQYGFSYPWQIALDKLRNLYVVDSTYEGINDANKRVLRFDASTVDPAAYGGNIFPLPPASGVYAKRGFNSDQDWGPGTPSIPVGVAFDSQNRMLLLVDSYGNPQKERAFLYGADHASQETPQPLYVLPMPFGQTAAAFYNGDDQHLILQDHTWNRILYVTITVP